MISALGAEGQGFDSPGSPSLCYVRNAWVQQGRHVGALFGGLDGACHSFGKPLPDMLGTWAQLLGPAPVPVLQFTRCRPPPLMGVRCGDCTSCLLWPAAAYAWAHAWAGLLWPPLIHKLCAGLATVTAPVHKSILPRELGQCTLENPWWQRARFRNTLAGTT